MSRDFVRGQSIRRRPPPSTAAPVVAALRLVCADMNLSVPIGRLSLNLEYSNSAGTLAFDFPEPDCWGHASAAEAIPLPKAKPRTLREHFVVSSIRSRKIARAQWSNVRHREDALKAFDFGNSLLGVHSVPISNIRIAVVKPSGICACPRWPVGAIPTGGFPP
jgi:hypothetical protein